MIKRVFFVALFTGSAHLISLLTIAYVVNNLGEEASGYIGVIDSTVLLISTITSFGIQLSVNRNAATQKGWRSSYDLAQSGRLALSFFVILFGIGSYLFSWDITKIIYFYAPLIALNGDYALYGNGKPVDAARLSFFRVAIPNLGLLAISQLFPESAIYTYIVLVAVGLFIAGFFSSRINHVRYIFRPTGSFYKIYYKFIKVGLFQVSSAILITGILTITKSFYTLATIGLVYGVLKYFEVFKGGLRIIIQTFFREFREDRTGFRIDKATMIIGGFMVIPTIIYPDITLSLIYNQTYAGKESMFIILGISMLIASIKTSGDITALLKKKDNLNLAAYLTAMIIAITTAILLSYGDFNYTGIPVAILAGEISLLLILGLGIGGIGWFLIRFKFLLTLVPALALVWALGLFLDRSWLILGTGAVIYIIWVLIFYRKIIFDTSFLIRN